MGRRRSPFFCVRVNEPSHWKVHVHKFLLNNKIKTRHFNDEVGSGLGEKDIKELFSSIPLRLSSSPSQRTKFVFGNCLFLLRCHAMTSFYEPILLHNGLSILLLCNLSLAVCFMCAWVCLRCFNGNKGTAADKHKITDEESFGRIHSLG